MPRDSILSSRSRRSRRSEKRDTAPTEQPTNSPYQHSLRAAESRFSLTEQFATTRREFEFGFDDTSSIFTRLSDNEEEEYEEEEVEEEVVTEQKEGPQRNDYEESDYYDLLVLPRGATLTQDAIRAAFYRYFLALYPESHGSKYRALASTQFAPLEAAYETLMDPARRAEYDLFGEAGTRQFNGVLEEKVRGELDSLVFGGTEVGLRLDAREFYKAVENGTVKGVSVRPLDYAVSQSMTVPLPVNRILPSLPGLPRFGRPPVPAKDDKKEKTIKKPSTYLFSTPTVTVAASLYGLAENSTQATLSSSLLHDRHQPLLPLTIPRHRILQLADLRCTPLIAVRVRQEFIHKARLASGMKDRWTKSAIEIESDVLPDRALTARLSHSFLPPYSAYPWNVEVSATNGRRVTGGIPRLGMGVYRRLGPGTAFVRVDSGDWRFGNTAVCNFFGQFASESRKWFFADFQFPGKTTPSVEVGYKTTSCERWTTTNYADVPRGESGIRGMDREASFPGKGSWAVSGSLLPGGAGAGFLRYSRDLPVGETAPVRVEVELCGADWKDHYIALRNLWKVGRFARMGLEVGVSPFHFHLSVYWSRLNQAISLPLLMSPRESMNEKVAFWTAVVPFVSMGMFQVVKHYFRQRKVIKTLETNDAAVKAWVIAKKNAAEDFEFLVESHVEARQKRESKKGGLVILSAKYGVKEGQGKNSTWSGSEVADVKIAIASLVDGESRVEIPEGVRKSHIPGFWDPAPLREKVLHVRYQYRGKEAVVEVKGREKLVLPVV